MSASSQGTKRSIDSDGSGNLNGKSWKCFPLCSEWQKTTIKYWFSEPECKKMNNSGSGYQSPTSNMPAMQAVQQVKYKNTIFFISF